MITETQFRADFVAFADTTKFPASTINFWIPHAYAMLNASRFKDQLDLAAELFIAHELALDTLSTQTGAGGGVPGIGIGVVNSQSVDKAAVGFDTSVGMEGAGAGYFNTTIYGRRLWRMKLMYTNGPVYRAPCTNARFLL